MLPFVALCFNVSCSVGEKVEGTIGAPTDEPPLSIYPSFYLYNLLIYHNLSIYLPTFMNVFQEAFSKLINIGPGRWSEVPVELKDIWTGVEAFGV